MILLRILRIIAVFSYLLIGGLNEHSTIIIGYLLLATYQFFSDLFSKNQPIFWYGVVPILIFVSVILFRIYVKYKSRYIALILFIILTLGLLYTTGIFYEDNYKNIDFGFVVPIIIFLASSIWSLLLQFKIKTNEME